MMRVKESYWPEQQLCPQLAPSGLRAVSESGTEQEVGDGRPLAPPPPPLTQLSQPNGFYNPPWAQLLHWWHDRAS